MYKNTPCGSFHRACKYLCVHQRDEREYQQAEQGQQGACAGDDFLLFLGLAQCGGQVGAGQGEIQQHHPAGGRFHIGEQAQQKLSGACEEQVQTHVSAADFENGDPVVPGEGEIVAHAEEHQGADGLTDEAGALGDDGQNADAVQECTDADEIEHQTGQGAEHQGRSDDLLHQLTHGGAVAGVGGQDADDGDADEALGQIQHAHAIGLGGAEEQDGQGDTQHAGLHGAAQQGQVGVGQLLLSDHKSQHGAGQGEGEGDGHGAHGLAADLSGQAGVEEHTGQGEADGELGQTLDLFLGHEILCPGENTHGSAEEDGNDDHCHMKKFFHNLPLWGTSENSPFAS